MTDDNPRITALTTDAIRSVGEKMVEEIRRQVEEVDAMAEGIRHLAKRYEDEIGVRTLELTDHITAYTALGAKTTEMFKLMSDAMKPLNGATKPMPSKREWEDEIDKLQAALPSNVDGRQ